MTRPKRNYPNIFLVIGLVSSALGFLLYFLIHGAISEALDLWPWLTFVLGLAMVYGIVRAERRPRTVFPASFVVSSGLLLMLTQYLPQVFPFVRFWPLFVSVAGASLYIASKFTSGAKRVYLHVPAVTLGSLSLLFLLLSTDVIDGSFSDIVARWWPALFMIIAIASLTIDLYQRIKRRWDNKDNRDQSRESEDPDSKAE